ncbi:unnamed protein product [Hyaloperonospora brassicae]|uniref:WRKY19-like zinc finger domain-containing protein n=1 Tax=Hyaloperonospora brassicae TaxID=162125 RepID=A0AAV0UMN6_HYABA|nr:unnamed protein product [Hyaloperonospora brassicae]
MMHTSSPRYYAPLDPPHNETVAVSIGLGGDRSTSIVLPRSHDVVKHLEQLFPAIAAPPPHQQKSSQLFTCARPAEMEVSDDDLRSRFSLPIEQSSHLQTQQTPRISSLSQYVRANSRYETTSTKQASSTASTNLPTNSPVYHSDSFATDNGSVHDRSQGSLTPPPSRRRSGCSKRCRVVSCNKIPVSRGLCRGHGGGRRCQHVDCAKGAQSRSDFCWAHGGGHRCHVTGCMRSRKSKLYCVAHLDRESPAPVSAALACPAYGAYETPRVLPAMPKDAPPTNSTAQANYPRLPSLVQALRKTRQSVVHTRQKYVVGE